MKLKQIIGLGAKITKAKFFKRKIPLKITFHITHRCNLRCHFCFRKTREASEMSTVQIKAMMKEFKSTGTFFWVFNGGEPLLREDLPELIDYAKLLGFHCSLVTNGVLLAQKLENNPSYRKLDFIQISLEGPQDIHDRMCGQGTYNRVIEALNLLKKMNIRTNILTLIAQDNIDYLDYLIEFVNQYHMTITFQPMAIQREDDLGLSQQHFPQKIRFKEVVDKLIKHKKMGAPIISSFEFLKMIRDCWPDIPNKIHCYAAQFYCNVAPDGYLTPCCAKLFLTQAQNQWLTIGFRKAFSQLGDMSKCQDCYYSGPQEFNITLRMLPAIDVLRILRKR
jgi:MoaA/NifB/PqqE/SkfB family radical SAM enzyme